VTMTLDEAMALASQDCPLPHRAGEALRVLRNELQRDRTFVPPALPTAFGMEGFTSRQAWREEHARRDGWNQCREAMLNRVLAGPSIAERYGSNSGHGHVWDRPDGVKARCGGPVLCKDCRRDMQDVRNLHASRRLEQLADIDLAEAEKQGEK